MLWLPLVWAFVWMRSRVLCNAHWAIVTLSWLGICLDVDSLPVSLGGEKKNWVCIEFPSHTYFFSPLPERLVSSLVWMRSEWSPFCKTHAKHISLWAAWTPGLQRALQSIRAVCNTSLTWQIINKLSLSFRWLFFASLTVVLHLYRLTLNTYLFALQ